MEDRKPQWLKRPIGEPKSMSQMRSLLGSLHLNTICHSANCPNIGECFKEGTATFLILGDECTRNCSFCNVKMGKPLPPDRKEPENVAEAVEKLGLTHVVITSVTRDDLYDKGSSHFAEVITCIKKRVHNATVEALIPDFAGEKAHLCRVLEAKPEVVAHNIETIPELYPQVRPGYIYERSLRVLEMVKESDDSIYTKSNIMVGLGEKDEDVFSIMEDLRRVFCDFLTIGQYLQPSVQHRQVERYVTPEIFKHYKEVGIKMGFRHISSGAFVRSSYQAQEALKSVKNHQQQIS